MAVIQPHPDGDIPEDGLEALARAMQSDWCKPLDNHKRCHMEHQAKRLIMFTPEIDKLPPDDGWRRIVKGRVSPVSGRCLVSVDRKTLNCQLYRAFDGEKEYQRIKKIGEFITQINFKYPQKKAVIIPEIPEFL